MNDLLWRVIHGLRMCRLGWFEERYACGSCDPEVLD